VAVHHYTEKIGNASEAEHDLDIGSLRIRGAAHGNISMPRKELGSSRG
jgi:hypothetical protein